MHRNYVRVNYWKTCHGFLHPFFIIMVIRRQTDCEVDRNNVAIRCPHRVLIGPLTPQFAVYLTPYENVNNRHLPQESFK